MNPLNITKSPPPPPASEVLVKRKRGRPRKDEASRQQENTPVTPKQPTGLVGQAVTGVVESAFEAGYFLNVKVNDSDTMLRGVVFIPGRVTPITPENDLAPNVKMYGKQEINNNQTVQPMKDAVTASSLENSDPTRALTLLAEVSNGQLKEKDRVIEEAETRLVEFFPRRETMMTAQVLKSVEAEKEIPPSETRGFDLMAEKPVFAGEKVPEELQLELGNNTIILSGDSNNNNNNNNNSMATPMETDPKTCVSKSGFIANLFEGVDKKPDCDMEENKAEEATPSVQ